MKITHSTKVNSASSIKASADIKPAGGDMINYVMVYTGPGYSENTPQAVLEWGKEHGFDKMFWGSDTAYRMQGIYNGDTYILYKDANKLPGGYKEDALDAEAHDRIMSCQMIEGATAEELQKKFAEYQKMNEQLGKQLDDLQQDQLSKFNKATQKKEKKGFFKRAFGSDEQPKVQKVAEDADSIEYVVSSEDLTCQTNWMGKYLTPKGEVKHVYFNYNTEDWDEAVQEFEDIIPEPYQSCKLLGKAPVNIASDETFTRIDSSIDSSDINPAMIEELKRDLGNEIHRFMVDVAGFDEEDDPNDKYSMGADHFWRVDVSETHAEDGTRGIYIEVGAELGYESTEKLLERLDDIIVEYDNEAYFEPYDPGISVCYLWENDKTLAATQINAASDYPATREKWLEPEDDPDINRIDDYQEEVTLDFDVDIDIADDGSYEYLSEDDQTESLEFAKDKTFNGDYYLTMDGLREKIRLRDYISVVEDLDELLAYRIPDATGVHHISGQADLIYDVSGLAEDEDGIFDYDLVVKFDPDASEIRNFKFD